MRIVWLTPEIPYPPIGGRNGVFNRIKQLSKYNDIYLFSIAYNEEEVALKNEMEKYCKEVHYYNRNSNRIKVLMKSLFLPFSVASRDIPALKEDIKNTIKNNDIDTIIVDFPNMARNIIGNVTDDMYCSLNQHNIEYQRMREMFKVKTISPIKRFAYYVESFRLQLYEKKIYKSNVFDSITFFSKDDLDFFRKKWKRCNSDLKLFPLGANGSNSTKEFDEKHTLLFIGRLDNVAVPNVEAVVWFCEKVFPLVCKEVPDAKLIIAGANPCSDVTKYRSDSVVIIPNYEDINSVYSLSDCVILPLQSGGGVKGKLLEAAALNKIIVSTSHGIEGTDFIDSKHVFLADNEEEFAKKCIYSINNKEMCREMALNSKKLFEEKYDWISIGKAYNDYLVSNH